MPGLDDPFFGRDSVAVPGQGAYAFHSVGNQNHATGFDVLFHPEGARDQAPGYGRMRVAVSDDLAWDVEYVGTQRLDEAVVRAAAGPARTWLESHPVDLLFALRGAVGIERAWSAKRRDDLANELSLREAILGRGPGAPSSAAGRAEAAREALESFEVAAAGRERVLAALSDVLGAYGRTRDGERAPLTDMLSEAREAFLAPAGPTP